MSHSIWGSLALQLPPKCPMDQRLEQMLRLALRFSPLGAQPLEFADDVGEF